MKVEVNFKLKSLTFFIEHARDLEIIEHLFEGHSECEIIEYEPHKWKGVVTRINEQT